MSRKLIRESLIEQLSNNGLNIEAYTDMVDDYMKLYDIKEGLQADIAERGPVASELNAYGLMVKKENPSVKMLLNTNKQMLMILDKLKICEKPVSESQNELAKMMLE